MARHPSMTAQEFVDKWRRSHLKERSGSQEHPTIHKRSDAYGWPHDLSDADILERLLALNLERAASSAKEA